MLAKKTGIKTIGQDFKPGGHVKDPHSVGDNEPGDESPVMSAMPKKRSPM
jgi:hypothetical protein